MSGANKKQELAQKARLEREAAERAAQERSKRIKLLGGAVGAVVVVVVLILALGVFKSDPTSNAGKNEVEIDGAKVEVKGAAETEELLAGIPQDGLTLGDPKAPVTIVEIADLKCPACQAHELETQPEVVKQLVRTGKANFQMRLVNFRDEAAGTTDGQAARNAANNLVSKNKFYNFVHTLYYNQGLESDTWATERKLKAVATVAPGVGVDLLNTKETSESRTLNAEAETLAKHLNTQGTPSIYVRPAGTNEYTNVPNFSSVDDISAAVAEATKKAKATR